MKKTFLTLLVTGALGMTAFADVVYVTSNTSNCTATAVCGSGPNPDFNINFVPVYNENGLGAFTGALAGTPDKPLNAGGARYFSQIFSNSTPDFGITISPTLGVTGGVYKVYHVYSSTANNVSTNIVLNVTNNAGGTLSFTETDKFQRSFGQPSPQQWQLLGFLTNDVDTSTPTITFYFKDGTVDAGSQNRLVVDTFRFSLYEPCTDVAAVNVTGPLSTNVGEVVVTGVSATATAITVYQDTGTGMVQIGTKTSDLATNNNIVTVTGLVQGARVAATQTINNQEGCVPSSGTLVGGAPNPDLRVALNVRENDALTGPLGAAGSGSIIHFIGSSGAVGGLGSAPSEGIILQASTNWQTIGFTNGIDPIFTWNGTDPTPGTFDGSANGGFGAVDGLAFASQGESGPFDIYIDDFENGTNGVIQDWESVPEGTLAHGFAPPLNSGSTSANMLTQPNVAVVTTAAAYSGTKSLRVRWQFADGDLGRWLRLVTTGSTPVANPQVVASEPISYRVLFPPPGFTPVSPVPGPLSIARDGSNVILDWDGTYQLESATDITGPFTPVNGITSGPYTNAIGTDNVFFRLSNPAN